MNFSHDINAIKEKDVTDEMLLALVSAPEEFNILAPMGVEFGYFEEEFYISASNEEQQSEDEIDSDNEYEVDGSVVEKNSKGEDGGPQTLALKKFIRMVLIMNFFDGIILFWGKHSLLLTDGLVRRGDTFKR